MFARAFGNSIRQGTLELRDAAGRVHKFGGERPGPAVKAHIRSRWVETKLLYSPELYIAEAWMDGDLTFEDGSTIQDLILLLSINRPNLAKHPSQRLSRRVRIALKRWHQANPITRAAWKARHHYDLSTDLYRLFLDRDLHYSCAYFLDPGNETIEQAQRNKLIHATSKLRLQPGMTVAEIGCGWGGFAIHIASETGAKVVAINVSPEQLRVAREKAAAAGVAHLVDFREIDYRKLEGKYDRVVSVGMMEHVGIGHFDEYFGTIRNLLADGGYAFIHCIGRMTPPGTTGAFFRKYIFPGSYAPALSEVFASTERNMLWPADLEILRMHYAYTLMRWGERFAKNRAQAAKIYDERFCRMWEFYLAAVEQEFRHGSHMVFQILLAKDRVSVPIARDFMIDDERAFHAQSRPQAAAG